MAKKQRQRDVAAGALTNEGRAPTAVAVVGTGFESIVMPHQIRTIAKLRLVERIGILTDEEHQVEIENRVLEHLGIAFEAEDL